mgnify:CR=1 FL=1
MSDVLGSGGEHGKMDRQSRAQRDVVYTDRARIWASVRDGSYSGRGEVCKPDVEKTRVITVATVLWWFGKMPRQLYARGSVKKPAPHKTLSTAQSAGEKTKTRQ